MTGPGLVQPMVDAASVLPAEPPQPKQTCLQCRARKVKCDGRLDLCGHCDRLGYDCSFLHRSDAGSPASLVPTRTPKSRRISKACRDCHVAKSRCSGTLPACHRCAAKGVNCVYPAWRGSRRRPAADTTPAAHVSRSSVESESQRDDMMPALQISPPHGMMDGFDDRYQHRFELLTRARVVSAMRKFFDHLHSLPSLAFLHRPSIMRLYRAQEADPALIASVVAVASRLPGTTEEETAIGFQCARMAQELVARRFNQPSIFRIQAHLLLLRFQLWTGSSNDPLLAMAHVARSAFMLGLNHETSEPAFHVQESRRRLMWAIYISDSMLTDGLPEYTACPIAAIHLRLPCMEDDFELGNENDSVRLHETTTQRLGIVGYYVRIIHLSDEILRYLKGLLNRETEPDSCKEFFQIEKKLEIFHSQLPHHERYSQENLSLRAFSPRLPRFVMTHVWWHVCHCQLFRCLLPTIPQTFSQRLAGCFNEALMAEYQTKCLDHAVSAALIFAALSEINSDTCILDSDMAECAFKAAEILLLSSESTAHRAGISQAEILQHASTCLSLVQSMLAMYPAIGPLVHDLATAVNHFARGGAGVASSFASRDRPARQAVSKHSALYRSWFPDDSYMLEIHYTSESRRRFLRAGHDGKTTAPGDVPSPPPPPLGDQSPGAQAGLPEAMPDTPSSHDAFAWPGVVPDMWDQVSFQGPFDGGDGQAGAGNPLPQLNPDQANYHDASAPS